MTSPPAPDREVFIPSLGVAMEEATLVAWLLQPGDAVRAGEAVAEIETDKSTMELEAPCDGVVGEHLFAAGATVPVGGVVVQILDPAEAAPAAAPASEPPTSEAAVATPAAAPAAPVASEPPAPEVAPVAAPAPQAAGGPRHHDSPRSRRLAREAGAPDPAAAPAPTPSAAAAPDPAATSAPAGAVRRTRDFRGVIAARVTESWQTIPHFAVTRAVDGEQLQRTLADARAALEEKVTLTDLMLRALARAVAASDGAEPVDVGLAVATERGVVIPVVRDVLGRDLGALAVARAAAVDRARDGRLGEEDLREPAPPTTLSNLGPFGVDHFTGVIALGQSSILTVGRLARQPVVDEHGGLHVRARFNATLNADHRIYDGADAARLLAAFAAAVDEPHHP